MADSQNKKLLTVWDYDTRTVSRYLREGECNSCGLCCRTSIQFSVVKPIDPENLNQGGWATSGRGIWAEVSQNGRRSFFRIRSYQDNKLQCKHQNSNHKCRIYQDRPILCREWPFTPKDIEPFQNCSYRFKLMGEWAFEEIQ